MAAGCRLSCAHARAGAEGRAPLHVAALLGVAFAGVLGLVCQSPVLAGVPKAPSIFNAPIALPGALGATDPSVVVGPTGTAYVSGSDGAGQGCVLDRLSPDGSAGKYLGRVEGGGGCSIAIAPSSSGSPDAVAYASSSPAGLVVSRSGNAGTTFTSALLQGATSAGAGSTATDPQLGVDGAPTAFLLFQDATTRAPELAVSIDGGLTYAAGASPINPADAGAALPQGLPALAGNLVARRDDTGLTLYTVFETGAGPTDTSYDRLFAAVGTVTPAAAPATAPTTAWHDFLVDAAPPGSQLDRPRPVTAVDAAGHVYVAFSDGTHVYVKADFDGAHWNASQAPATVDSFARIPGGLTSSLLPALAAGGNGIVDLAWYAASNPDPTKLGSTADASNAWGVYLAQTTDSGTTWAAYPVTNHAIHQGALCVAGDAACAASQQSPSNPPVAPSVQVAIDQLSGAATVAYDDDVASPGLPSLSAARQCGGLSAVTGQPLGGTCAAPAVAPASSTGSTCPGPQITHLAGAAIDNTAKGSGQNILNLDITQEVLNQTPGGDLVAAITVQHLDLNPGAPDIQAQTWALHWTYAGVHYYATATLAPKAQTYRVGTVGPDGTLGPVHAVTGALIPGVGGRILMSIPARDVGRPSPGALLGNTYAASYATYATGAATPGDQVLVERAPDAGFGAPAMVGLCPPASDVPDAPIAVMLPLGAAAGGSILWMLRRKRSRRSVNRGAEGGIPRGIAGSQDSLENSR